MKWVVGTAWAGTVMVILLALDGGGAAASPLRLFGFGSQSSATAGTGIAGTSGYHSSYLNPAGLGYLSTKRATLGLVGGQLSLRVDGDAADVDPAFLRTIGLAVPIPLGGALRDRVGLGIGLYVPHDTLNKARAPTPGTPTYAVLANASQVISVNVGVGVRLGDGWSVGVGVLTLATLIGEIHVGTDGAGRFITASEEELITHVAPIAGVQRRLRSDLVLGAVVRAPSKSGYDVALITELGEVLPLQVPELVVAGVAQYDPATLAVELAWTAAAGLQVRGQLAYERWSAFPLLAETPTRNIDATESQVPPGFHDTLVPRLGLTWSASCVLELRGGYSFAMTPAPEMRGPQSLLDNHRHIVSAGLGADFSELGVPVRLEAWVQGHYLMPRTHTKDPALFESPEQVPFDSIKSTGAILAGGATLGVEL